MKSMLIIGFGIYLSSCMTKPDRPRLSLNPMTNLKLNMTRRIDLNTKDFLNISLAADTQVTTMEFWFNKRGDILGRSNISDMISKVAIRPPAIE